MKKLLLIDRDGTLIREPLPDYQVDSLQKFSFVPGALTYLGKIARELDYVLVMVTNQDGLGTESFPENDFWPLQEHMLITFEGEGVTFEDIHIDRSFPADESPYRKPGTAMLSKYMNGKYDLQASFVIGDRMSDMKLAQNLGAGSIHFIEDGAENILGMEEEVPNITISCTHWKSIYDFLKSIDRSASLIRNTKETAIAVGVNLDGTGVSKINTGLSFFDHMLDQLARHGNMDLEIEVKGDLEVDEHHTVEDTALALGECLSLALGKKIGISRYGFCLPMDDVLAQVAIDFGGRPWLVWDAPFRRDYVGDVPTEMFYHFFKSFSDSAKCNLNIQVSGANEHHKIESIFKAFARAIRMAVHRDSSSDQLPSTKGIL
jgi:imidazoleglycerol-phosphate dehydratase/histidinol-phosphatase